ncbi:MAG: glycosyltransferase [Planctomycetes bacterium]|nr:glycosyltransferase [Planctomycetota bacterium]
MPVSPFKLEELARLLDQGKFAQVEAGLHKLGRISPGDPNVAALLTDLFAQTARFEQAVFAAERRAALLPHDLGAQSTLIEMLFAAQRPDEAIKRARALFQGAPKNAGAVLTYASALLNGGRPCECAAVIGEALAAGLKGDDLRGVRASANLAMGRTREASVELREILLTSPGHRSALSLLATVLNYVVDADPEDHYRVHVEYGKEMAKLQTPAREAPARPGNLPLTVGMLSADLREHSVSRFVEPIVRNVDRGRIRTVLVSMGARPDATSQRLASLADSWRDLRPMSWQRLREICIEEKIDVMIELGGHMTNTPLPFMIPRVAGVQGTAIGYPNTTGLPTIDFRLVDSITDPPGVADPFATEKLVRIDPCFLCFQPPESAPDVSPLPALKNGHITFGSFNAFSKLNDELLADWAELLRRVPGSKLCIKGLAADDPGTKRDLETRAAQAGIAPERLTVLGKEATTRSHLERYFQVDIALDTFPYHGTTTTCEALWMGVPVVTRSGTTHASRVGTSLLSAVGLTHMIATDRNSYLAIAESLAKDPAALATLRATLRDRVGKSPLCDGPGYARRWEKAVIEAANATVPAPV